jgi:hypothetical protein
MLRSRQSGPFFIWTLPFAAGTRIHFSSDGGSSGLGPYWHLENSKPASRQTLPPLLGWTKYVEGGRRDCVDYFESPRGVSSHGGHARAAYLEPVLQQPRMARG